jgi:hypothetical protein
VEEQGSDESMASCQGRRLIIESGCSGVTVTVKEVLTREPNDNSPSIRLLNSGLDPYSHSQVFNSFTPSQTFCSLTFLSDTFVTCIEG